jgi:trigger factor
MKVSVIEKGEISRTLQIEIPSDVVTKEYERVYNKVAASANIPGFRKGKVPRAVLEPQVKGTVLNQMLDDLLPKVTFDAVKQESLKAVGQPQIDDLKYEDKGPHSFKAKLEVKPEFHLSNIEGLKLSAPKDSVSDKDVDEQVEALRRRQAKAGAELERPAANGDTLKIDFQGFIEGQPFPGGTAQDYDLVLGQNSLIPGFEEQLLGAKKGDSRQVKVSFPADYPAQDVAGKPAEFVVQVKEIRATELPAVDDTWAKTFGEEVTDLAFLRERLKEAVASQKKQARLRRLMDGAADELLARHKFPVPDALWNAEAHAMEQQEMRNMANRGMQLADSPESHQALHAALREPAEKRARLTLVLEKIAEAQKLEASDEEFEHEMERAAPSLGLGHAEAIRWARQSGREAGIRAQICERKALQWVVDKAKVEDIA